MTSKLLSADVLTLVAGGLAVPPRPIPEQPLRPENHDFFGPYVQPDLSYRPDRDGEPRVEQEPLRPEEALPAGPLERDASVPNGFQADIDNEPPGAEGDRGPFGGGVEPADDDQGPFGGGVEPADDERGPFDDGTPRADEPGGPFDDGTPAGDRPEVIDA